MTTVREQVAEEVRALLARRRLTARAAARDLGWSAMYLSRRMTGAAPFTVDDLAALSELLDVPVTSFFAPPLFDHQIDRGGVSVGSNKQNYWTPQHCDLRTYPLTGVAIPLQPHPADLVSVA